MFRASQLALTAAFVALAVAFGFLLSPVPNVELLTLTVFLGGAVTGVRAGWVIGGLAIAVYSTLNPLGPPLPLVFVAQILGGGIAGATGGFLARRLAGLRVVLRAATLAVTGGLVTLVYDALTNTALGVHLGPVLPTLLGGLSFGIVHVLANAVSFALLGPPALALLGELGQLGESD